MTDYLPVFEDGPFTRTASATIVGGQLVTASGNGTVAPSTTGDHSIGVAGHDAANGAPVTCYPIGGLQHETTIQGVVAIAAGAPIVAGTAGSINTAALATAAAAGTLLGICVSGGTGGTGTGKAQWMGIA